MPWTNRPQEGCKRICARILLLWTLAPFVIVGFTLVFANPEAPPPPSVFSLGVFLVAFALIVLALKSRSPALAAWVQSIGTLLIVLLAWRWFPASNIHFAFSLPVIIASVTLGFWSGMGIAALASLLLVFGSPYPFSSLMNHGLLLDATMLWTMTFLVSISQRPQNMMIAWLWSGYEQARRNLERARDHQLELKQALEDLTLARNQAIRLNELLLAARQAVDEARRAKADFVAKVSHELRTPLNMIIGFSDMILETPQVYSKRLPAALLADVAAIKRNSQHLASLVDDVLGLAEADSGRMQLFQEMTSIKQVAAEAAEAVRVLFRKKGLDLVLDLPGDLPDVYCDRIRVRQVLLNLLSNAGRFTAKGVHGYRRGFRMAIWSSR